MLLPSKMMGLFWWHQFDGLGMSVTSLATPLQLSSVHFWMKCLLYCIQSIRSRKKTSHALYFPLAIFGFTRKYWIINYLYYYYIFLFEINREPPSFGKSCSHNFNLQLTYLGDIIFINEFPQRTQLFTFKTLLLWLVIHWLFFIHWSYFASSFQWGYFNLIIIKYLVRYYLWPTWYYLILATTHCLVNLASILVNSIKC